VDGSKEVVGGGDDDRKAVYPVAGRAAPNLPEAGEGERPVIGERQIVGLLAAVGEVLPFVEAVGDDEAAAPCEGGAKRRQAVERLGAGIDGPGPDSDVLGPRRDQSQGAVTNSRPLPSRHRRRTIGTLSVGAML
jgi:hypothetical protein